MSQNIAETSFLPSSPPSHDTMRACKSILLYYDYYTPTSPSHSQKLHVGLCGGEWLLPFPFIYNVRVRVVDFQLQRLTFGSGLSVNQKIRFIGTLIIQRCLRPCAFQKS